MINIPFPSISWYLFHSSFIGMYPVRVFSSIDTRACLPNLISRLYSKPVHSVPTFYHLYFIEEVRSFQSGVSIQWNQHHWKSVTKANPPPCPHVHHHQTYRIRNSRGAAQKSVCDHPADDSGC